MLRPWSLIAIVTVDGPTVLVDVTARDEPPQLSRHDGVPWFARSEPLGGMLVSLDEDRRRATLFEIGATARY